MTIINPETGKYCAPSFIGINEQIAIHGRFRAKELALIEGARSLDWASYNAIGNRIGQRLIHQGVQKGDRIALLVSNTLWAHELLLGIWRAGAVAVPLSPMLHTDTLTSMLKDCGARMLFASGSYIELAEQSVKHRELTLVIEGEPFTSWIADAEPDINTIDFSADDLAVIIYSSGTTGTPKGIAHSHGSRLNFASVFATQFRFHSQSLALSSIPLHSNGAWLSWLPAKWVGATTVILPHFSPAAFIDTVKKHRPTHGFIVPTMCAGLVEFPGIDEGGLDCFEAAITAGAPMPTSQKAAMTALTGNGLYELWGLTEGVGTVIDPHDMVNHPTAVGRPMLGCDIRMIDEHDHDVTHKGPGEIVGRSSIMMNAYWNRPDANKALIWKDKDGKAFIRTGDIGEFNSDGFLVLRGRIKDMIISGGVNVFPIDIEKVLLDNDHIKDASVVGVEHAKWGETPVAFVIAKDNDPIDANTLKHWANERLAKHQRLHDLVLQNNDFPRNTLGKVMKNKLIQNYNAI